MTDHETASPFNPESQSVPSLITSSHRNFPWRLIWRQKMLIVKPLVKSASISVKVTINQDHLVACLQHSPVKRVKLDLALGADHLNQWANAGHVSGKQVFVSLPSASKLPQYRSVVCWRVKRSLEWLTALLLLVGLMPLIGLITMSLKLSGSTQLVQGQWAIGERGRLFQVYRFDVPANVWGYWMRRFRLDKLPQLGQVLRGEMSLIGPRSQSLEQAACLDPELRSRLNALPGITGLKWRTLDLNVWSRCDLLYLSHWSLVGDVVIFCRSLPRLLLGIKFEESNDVMVG